MNKSQVINRVKSILHSYVDMFELPGEFYKQPQEIPSEINGIKYISFYYPFKIGVDDIDGYKLKDSKGFISIQETFKFTNNTHDLEKVSHVYKYITDENIYRCEHLIDGTTKNIKYNFHYDMDLDYIPQNDSNLNHHPTNHLQVLHPHPRFETEEINVEAFILQVRGTCYKNLQLDPFIDPLFSIRHI